MTVYRSLVLATLLTTSLAGCVNSPVMTYGQGAAGAQSARQRVAPSDPSRVIVKFRAGGSGQAAALARRFGLTAARVLPGLDAAVLAAPRGQSALAKLSGLMQDASVVYAEPTYTFSITDPKRRASAARRLAAFSDPELAQQWGLEKIGMARVWAVTQGRPDVTVAVLDTGVDLDHPDLRANLVPGRTMFENQTGPQDANGHGTHVAGIIAGVGGNGVGIVGVAPKCTIMPIQVMGESGKDGSVDRVAEGLVWAVDHGAKVVNMSLGSEGSSALLRDAVRYALAHDVVVVAASGNLDPARHASANTMDYPAAYPGVIAVGATDNADTLAEFSFWGTWLSVVAPGVDIYSTIPTDGSADERVSGRYEMEQGTSMAAPFVAGVAALIRSRFPTMKASEVKRRIEASARDLGPAGYDPHHGHGRLDAAAAVLGP